MQIPFYSLAYQHQNIRKQLIEQMTLVLDSHWYIQGEQVKAFESEFAAFCQTNHCIGISNGLDALHVSLRALALGPGDEVIVSAHCFIACVLAITHTGATPVFVEPDLYTYNINPTAIEAAITPRTKAIMAVHMYGQPCDMQAITGIAGKYKLWIVEDFAQAQGAKYANKLVGSWGHINATSFYPVKNLGALGDAGAITTPDVELAEMVRKLQNYGSSQKYYSDIQGFNTRLDELQAALLHVKLHYLSEWNQQRQQLAHYYIRYLADLPSITLPVILPEAHTVWHLFVIKVSDRQDLQSYLTEKGIGTMIHYPVPPHLQQAYKNLGYQSGSFPIAELIADTCLSLPLYPGLSSEAQDYIISNIRDYYS
ncbi:DegT/DnrJ/EryC1/StrS family aminotransferase [Xanthocytophaga agilis]|uniref:DegT/DnrJ/EryC1/StrS family aminotransferase n=1 Tax=Xanthocytophaga agilis TaxID=3048010 RepID=A0AAE3UG09_9BACT|nr:DegT/DnrJ/EryC1/StrS family aminotransferase [Xanthocytophaga agilis]MDJ1503880.1 DegT/DnrJ/EryC1/StrS family aminotransferase [Xanthocytophaga agilis]